MTAGPDRYNNQSAETRVVHTGWEPDALTGSISPPVHFSSTFQRDLDGGYDAGFSYARENNPTRAMLEAAIAELESAEHALCFSSGMAAITAVVQAMSAGDHAVVSDDAYHGTTTMLRDVFPRWNFEFTQADLTNPDAVRKAVRPNTRLIWIETPTNPRVKVADIAALAQIGRDAGAVVAVDNTWATPLLQSPLDLGADIAMHATTKYLGGHSDLLGGALAFRENNELAARIAQVQKLCGAVAAPFDCWLTLRGIRTLAVRMPKHCENAQAVAEFLESHAGVERIHYPGLASHPQHELAQRQMKAFGGMLSFEVPGGRERAFEVANRLRLIKRATSLGGVESLIEHRASIEGPHTPTPEGLLRMSVGIESAADLIADLDGSFGETLG
ncbi:MAG: PLP-dependent transferase [Planctomycetota bacterium]